MAIDYDRLMALRFPDTEHSYTRRDTILYGLGLGFGGDPLSDKELRYVYERDLVAFPTMAVVLGQPSLRNLDLGITYEQVVHGEQGVQLHAPLPVEGPVVAQLRIGAVVDRGTKGALIRLDRTVFDKQGGTLLAEAAQTVICRADGGFGGPVTSAPAPHAVPVREPDTAVRVATLPQQALIYRLSGDLNPLHAEPKAAAAAGFQRPILHGLATFGIVGRGVVQGMLEGEGALLHTLEGRFSAPVFPGETIEVQLWREQGGASVRARAVERDKLVFSNGRAAFRAVPRRVEPRSKGAS